MDSFAWNNAFSLLSSARLANDLLLTGNGLKPCCRLTIKSSKIPELRSLLERLDLVHSEMRFSKLSIQRGEQWAYSASSSSCTDDGVEYATVFVSRFQDVSSRALNASDLRNDYDLGRLLGYPNCCASHFVALRALAQENSMSLLPYLDGDATRFDKLLNVWGWFLDAGVTGHFPCSLTCDRSSALARKSLSILDQIAPRQADDLVDLLSAKVSKTDHGFDYTQFKTGRNYALSKCGEELSAQTCFLNPKIDSKLGLSDHEVSCESTQTFEFH